MAWRGSHARTPDRRPVGAGLGLAIVKGLVEAHDGQVAVHNQAPGCRFLVAAAGLIGFARRVGVLLPDRTPVRAIVVGTTDTSTAAGRYPQVVTSGSQTVGGSSLVSLAMKKTAGSPSRRTDGRTTMAGGDREKALDAALANIERQFGKGSVMRLGEETRAALEVIPTGAIALDIALGIGGLPRGRVVEIYGPESSGKTTVALHAVANAQRAGGIVAFIDAEHALDPDYAKALGVDTDALLVSQPDSGEQALEIADMLVRSGALDLIVIDSVAALVPRAEIEGEMGDSHVGLQARLMSQALRKMTGALNGAGTTMIFINQLREKIGVMFGSPGDHHRWPGAEVLRLGAARRPPHRDAQGRPGDGRQPDPHQGREEQGRAAVQAGRVRHHVRPGHQPRGRPDRRRRRGGPRPQGRRLVHLRGRPARPGQGERPHLPARQPRPRQRAREADPREARHRPHGRRARRAPADGADRARRSIDPDGIDF